MAFEQSNLVYVVTVVALVVGFVIMKSGVLSGSSQKTKFVTREGKKAKLIERIEVSHDTSIFRFSTGSANAVLGLPIGKHIRLECPNPKPVEEGKWNGRDDLEAGKEIVDRKYTPITLDSTTSGHFDILVKIYRPNERFVDGGKMSRFLDSLKVGDKVDVSGPFGMIEYEGRGLFKQGKAAIQAREVGMICGGSGITPMFQIASAILRDPSDPTKISLLYANQTPDDILLKKELDGLAAAHPGRFRVHYTVDRAPEGWTGSVGFVTEDMIRAHLPAAGNESLVLLCGPPPMVKFACHANLDKLDWAPAMRLQF